jgi:hypothetical protein
VVLPALYQFFCLFSPGPQCLMRMRQVTAWMKDVDYLFIADNACTYKVRARRYAALAHQVFCSAVEGTRDVAGANGAGPRL